MRGVIRRSARARAHQTSGDGRAAPLRAAKGQ